MKYLVIQRSDWADEFECEKYQIFDQKEDAYSFVEEVIANGGYFGSNQGWDKLYDKDFTVKEISDEESEVLVKLLGKYFGTGL